MTTTTRYTFGEFLLSEMRQRDMSAREFARFVGISPGVINKFLDYGQKDVGYPSVDFLFKLADATNTDIGALMRMLKPDYDELDPQAMVIAEELVHLTRQERTVIETLVRSMRKTRSGDQDS